MRFTGTDLRETIGRAVRGEKDQFGPRRRMCAQMWVKLGDYERELSDMNSFIEDLEREMQSHYVRQMIAATELGADILSLINPTFRVARRLSRLVNALRRAIQGRRMAGAMEELRELLNVLADIESAIDNFNSLLKGNARLASLSAKFEVLRNRNRMLRNHADTLQREYQRLDCDNVPESDGFVGVGFGK